MASEVPPGGQATPISSSDRAVALMHQLGALKTNAPGAADPSERALARVIDFWAGLAVLLCLGMATTVVAYATGNVLVDSTGLNHGLDSGAIWASNILILVAGAAYELGPSLFGWQPLGKRLLHLSVVRQDGRPASFRMLATRFAVWFLPLVVLMVGWSLTYPGWDNWWFFAGALALFASLFISMARSDDHRGWHDRLAGTSVVRPH